MGTQGTWQNKVPWACGRFWGALETTWIWPSPGAGCWDWDAEQLSASLCRFHRCLTLQFSTLIPPPNPKSKWGNTPLTSLNLIHVPWGNFSFAN